GTAIQDVKLAGVPPRGVRHRQATCDVFAGRYFNHHPAIAPVLAPAFMHIRRAHRRHERGGAVAHREAVEMAAIFRRETRDEGRLPDWAKAMRVTRSGETGEEGIHENRPARVIERDIVSVDIA